MNILRVTCDTNTLLRMAHAGPKSELYSAWRNGQLLLVLSEAIYEELADVLGRPKTWRYVDEERGAAFLKLLRQRAEFVTPNSDTPPCRDPDDLAVVGTALAGQVPYLVSSDKDLYDGYCPGERFERTRRTGRQCRSGDCSTEELSHILFSLWTRTDLASGRIFHPPILWPWRRDTVEHTFRADILVDIRPMYAVAIADNLIISPAVQVMPLPAARTTPAGR